MPYREVRKGRLADLVTGELKKAIFNCQYKPGKRLPSENELVKIYDVSRVVIREAIRNLEHSGLVEIKEAQREVHWSFP